MLGPSKLEFASAEGGEEVLRMTPSYPLRPSVGTNTVVMMQWEKGYMEALVAALQITGDDDVLETTGLRIDEVRPDQREPGARPSAPMDYLWIIGV